MIERFQGIGNQGPYSQGVMVQGWVFTSGQIPLVPATGALVTGSISEQTRQVLDNLTEVLAACGATRSQVVKTTVYLTDLGDFSAFNAVYAEYFPADRPARACVQVAALPRGVNVEVEAVAFVG